MENKDFRCSRCNEIRKGVGVELIDHEENKDPIYKANCEVCGFEMFTKPEHDPPDYYEYITVMIIFGIAWRRFRFLKLGFMLCRGKVNRLILEMKDVDQVLNDFAKLDWELISIENVKSFPDYNYIKKEYKLIKIDSIFYLFFKRKYCGKILIPKIGSDYTETRIEEIEEIIENLPTSKSYKSSLIKKRKNRLRIN